MQEGVSMQKGPPSWRAFYAKYVVHDRCAATRHPGATGDTRSQTILTAERVIVNRCEAETMLVAGSRDPQFSTRFPQPGPKCRSGQCRIDRFAHFIEYPGLKKPAVP